ncbi:MAG: hypothetical protein RML75_00325, partial [Cyanobacteriota bacterium SKYGB_h_bin112]|nr:hypothetical protein [Cyanobacteriota bacterium SKYGB_h_bin112]
MVVDAEAWNEDTYQFPKLLLQMAGSQDLSPWYELMGCVAGFGEEMGCVAGFGEEISFAHPRWLVVR